MANRWKFLNTWDTIKEVDLRPLRERALKIVNIAIVGAPGSGRAALADQLRRDPARPQLEAHTPVQILDLEYAHQAVGADLIILIVDSRERDTAMEQELVRSWHNRGQRVLVFINQVAFMEGTHETTPAVVPRGQGVVWGSVQDSDFLLKQFAPQVINLLHDQLTSLGRHLPLFRVPVARYLINDTCVSNAAYAFSTGLAETVAVLDIPIAVTDMIILSKNQALLAYKVGLALGFSTRWQDYVVEFGGVLGGGFIWREIARTLVGFIPVWGIVPKSAIAYAGTYVIGQAILQWYLTGRHVSRKQLRHLYQQALSNGRDVALRFLGRMPRPRIPKVSRPRLPRPRLRRRTVITPLNPRICSECDQTSAPDAYFCQYCGAPFFHEGVMLTSGESGPELQTPPIP